MLRQNRQLALVADRFYTHRALKALFRLNLLRLFSLIAVGASVALFVEYTSAQSAFCSAGSGCSQLRVRSAQLLRGQGFASALPLLGFLGFNLLFWLSLFRSERVLRVVLRPLCAVAALGALGLIGLQAYLGSFCYLCMIVDCSALALGALALSIGQSAWDSALREEMLLLGLERKTAPASQPEGRSFAGPAFGRNVWVGLFVLALLAPLLFPRLTQRDEVPAVIEELYLPEKLTVVEFFDFECPHCRELSPRLKRIAEQQGAQLVYGFVPLPGHDGARYAAKLTICAQEQGAGDQVAAAFFQNEDFSSTTLREMAAGLVEDPTRLYQCVTSNRPDKRIESDTARLKAAGFEGLPTTYVGGIRLLGAMPDPVVSDAFRKVAEGKDRSGMTAGSYWLVVLLFAVAIGWSGWTTRRPETSLGLDDSSTD